MTDPVPASNNQLTAAKAYGEVWLRDATVLVEPSPEYDEWLREGPATVRAMLAVINSRIYDAPVPDSNVSEGLLLDAVEFGHNLAVTGRESLGHYGTFDKCPQRLCQRVRAALATEEAGG